MITRRALLKAGVTAALMGRLKTAGASEEKMEERIASIIREYDAQGIHRTGTDVDNVSAEWMASRITGMGVTPEIDAFEFERVEILDGRFEVAGVGVQGIPMFDCGFTDANGVKGRVGPVGSDAEIIVAMTLPFAAGPGFAAIEAIRRKGGHKALVLVTDKRLPPDGIATINAEAFDDPYGAPVLQIANAHWPAILNAMEARAEGHVVAHCTRVPATARNVQARIAGSDPDLEPLVVMTPRSGWWQCASERGGGIAAYFEIMRAIRERGAARDVIFTANTGHELGHMGLDHYLEGHARLIKDAAMWIHLGASFAAKIAPAVHLQYSDDSARETTQSELDKRGLKPASETMPGTRPNGEARNIFDGGGRYMSILGGNGLFHHPDDRWPAAVDLPVTRNWVGALADLASTLALAERKWGRG